MTTQHSDEAPKGDGDLLPDDLLAARDRIEKSRARASSRIGRGRARRRILPQVLAVSAVLVTLAAADRFVQGAIPAPTAASSALPARSSSTSSSTQALAQLGRTLAADQRAIDALAITQARLARGAEGDGGGASSATAIQLPSLPSVGALPSIQLPAATSVPAVSATTGASVVVP